MKFNIASIRKAVVAVVTPAVTFAVGWVILKTGLHIDESAVIVIDGAISSAITGVVVHQVPNAS